MQHIVNNKYYESSTVAVAHYVHTYAFCIFFAVNSIFNPRFDLQVFKSVYSREMLWFVFYLFNIFCRSFGEDFS